MHFEPAVPDPRYPYLKEPLKYLNMSFGMITLENKYKCMCIVPGVPEKNSHFPSCKRTFFLVHSVYVKKKVLNDSYFNPSYYSVQKGSKSYILATSKLVSLSQTCLDSIVWWLALVQALHTKIFIGLFV